MSTYIELVNTVIAESKQTLDPLTSVNFAAPPRTDLYNKIKTWVSRAYQELVNERPEWFFTSERAKLTVRPRVVVTGTTYVQPGDTLIGQTSGAELVVYDSAVNVEPTDIYEEELTISFVTTDATELNKLYFNEVFDILPANPVDPPRLNVGVISGRGRYNFKQEIPTLDHLKIGTVQMQPLDLSTSSPQDMLGLAGIEYKDYNVWAYSPYEFGVSAGRPIAITREPDGLFDFYPRPDKAYTIAFEYSQKANSLTLPGDIPVLLAAKYHDYLVWAALIELADFNKDQVLYARAKKKRDLYFGWILRDYLPKVSFDLYRFDH